MSWWHKLRGKEKTLNTEEKTQDLTHITSKAETADWHNPTNAKKVLEAIINTWGVKCTIIRLTEQQVHEVEQQYPLGTNFTDQLQQYHVRVSSNSIFIHEHGSWINFGYFKFLYHDKIYYVNVTPLVKLTTSVFSRMDDLSHMAKIMITLGECARSDRTPFMICLEGDLAQK